jgi:hypothetical protein
VVLLSIDKGHGDGRRMTRACRCNLSSSRES